MSLWKLLSVTVLLSLSAGCVWKPITYDEGARGSVEKAVAEFRKEDALQSFFDEAVAYVVFPTSVRGGTGFGGAFGSGWLVENDKVTGRTTMFEIFAGANMGAQAYRSILFFQTEKSLGKFKKGRFEFSGQANAAVVTVGVGLTPSHNYEVAMFTQLRGGLLLEASVGTQRYDFFPLAEDTNE
jgi:lipid-binding SYLF domain-containing protein